MSAGLLQLRTGYTPSAAPAVYPITFVPNYADYNPSFPWSNAPAAVTTCLNGWFSDVSSWFGAPFASCSIPITFYWVDSSIAGTDLARTSPGVATPVGDYPTLRSYYLGLPYDSWRTPIHTTMFPASDPGASNIITITTTTAALMTGTNDIGGTQCILNSSHNWDWSYPPTVPTGGKLSGYSVITHELTYPLGRYSHMHPTAAHATTAEDYLSYSAPGTRKLTDALPRYLSFDDGTTNLTNFADPGEPQSFVGYTSDPFAWGINANVLQYWTALDFRLMFVLGLSLTPPGRIKAGI